MSWKLQELWYLSSGIVGTLFAIFFDSIVGRKQLTIKDILDTKIISDLIDEEVINVEQKVENSFGAGGTGTSRFKLDAFLKSGQKLALFVKLPTESLFERVFLTLFQVYDNEFNFYAKVRSLLPDMQARVTDKFLWCPKVHHAK